MLGDVSRFFSIDSSLDVILKFHTFLKIKNEIVMPTVRSSAPILVARSAPMPFAMNPDVMAPNGIRPQHIMYIPVTLPLMCSGRML